MKKLISPLLTILIIFGSYAYTVTHGDLKKLNAHDLIYFDPCENPVTFKIGSVDERFKISEKEVTADVQKAANIWNKTYGRELFVYDVNGTVPIDFIYDERQKLDNLVSSQQAKLNKDNVQVTSAINKHNQEFQNLQKRIDDLKKRFDAYNTTVNYWNARNGAPPDEYQKLTTELQGLKTEQDNLQNDINVFDSQTKSLGLSNDAYNLQVKKYNMTLNEFKQTLVEKPEEGLYKGETNSIEIYFVNGTDELVHTIAHELGHARGVDHNNNKVSIMYPFTNQSTKLSKDDLEAVKTVCQEQSYYEIYKNRLQFLISNYYHTT